MYSCVFFGHRRYNYTEQKERIKEAIVRLVKTYGVTCFFSGHRGAFDYICVEIVKNLKKDYPGLRVIRVFSYMPQKATKNDETDFDGSVFLLERAVPPRYAILETNKKMVEKADFVLSGAMHDWGGAATAIAYAYKKGKTVVDLFGAFEAR